MTNYQFAKLVPIAAVFISGLFAGMAKAENSEQGYWFPGSAKAECQVSQSSFNDTWAKITFPEVEGWAEMLPVAHQLGGQSIGPFYDAKSGMVYVFPPNGPAFQPSGSNHNCDFFTWSSQMFYWLTSTVTDVASFPTDTTPPTDKTNYVFASEFFYHLDDGALVAQDSGIKTNGVRTEKSNADADSIEQAGGGGVLFFQPQTTESSDTETLVYYSVHTNRPFGYLRAGNLASTPLVPAQFPDSQAEICDTILYAFLSGYADILDPISTGLYALYCAGADGSQQAGIEELLDRVKTGGANAMTVDAPQGVSITMVETAVDYLSMAVELKLSWVEANTLSNPGDYLLQTGTIPTFTKQTDGTLLQTSTKTTTMALTGMHVVGSVKGHPEMIWATFEHKNNAPDVNYVYLGADDHIQQWSELNQGEWLFSNGTANNSNAEYARGTIPANGALTIEAADGIDIADLTTPTNVNRLSPWGSHLNDMSNKSAVTEVATMNTAVISANTAAIDALNGFYGSDMNLSDPRVNYILTGASWGENGVLPQGSKVSQIAGTPAMANTTMETFQQIYQGQISQTGCFSCHGVYGSTDRFKVSHIFGHITSVAK